MRSIEALVPKAGQVDDAGLSTFDADKLARYVADATNPWWRRRACAVALAGRVPPQHVADLLARICDPADVGEVRKALLDIFPDRTELIAWLQHEDRQRDGSYGMPEAYLKARGVLGDRSAASALTTLAASFWPHEQVLGEVGLDALVARHGVDVVLADLGDTRPQHRAFRVRMRHRAGEDVTDALADGDRAVAYLAQSLLTDPDRLRAYLDEAPTTEAKLWAAYALHRLTGDAAETRAIYDKLGCPRVEVTGLDAELRTAILHRYAPVCEPPTDPRWRVEALCAQPTSFPDQEEQLRRAMAALTATGLAAQPPICRGQANQQGDATFDVIEFVEDDLFISTLGRFVTADDADPTARVALESAGFRWIDETTGTIRVTDLYVYHYGQRQPLRVHTLLFYWHD